MTRGRLTHVADVVRPSGSGLLFALLCHVILDVQVACRVDTVAVNGNVDFGPY